MILNFRDVLRYSVGLRAVVRAVDGVRECTGGALGLVEGLDGGVEASRVRAPGPISTGLCPKYGGRRA